jgi:erythromycin esterase-like protein
MARPVTGVDEDYAGLLSLVGDRRLVLIGEASHGTHEFYRERARITRRLIDELGFTVVAVEGDWPDAYRVNRYVMGMAEPVKAFETEAQDFFCRSVWMVGLLIQATVGSLGVSIR